MKEEILRDKLQNLSVEQLGWINEYCDNNMSKLKKISYNAFFRYGIPEHEHDELYDDAMNVLMESVVTFDSSQGANFNTYLTNNIKKSVIDWYRDNYQRGKAYMENNDMMTASALSAMAAQRITEATEFPAMTIHRTLGCQGLNDFTYNKDNHLITDVAFLDEGSMVNASLFLHWLEAIGDNTRIIISGDHKQLPPIGFGNVFSDLIEMFDESVVSKLVKPMRQAEKSGILVDANKIRENINPISEKLQPRIIHGELQDMYYMFRTNRQSLFNIAIKTFIKSVESDGIDNVVIAVPRRKDCLNSTNEINKVIQNELLGDVLESIEGFDTTFKLGAKVMQTVNDYDKNVFNGEIGYVTKIGERYDGKKKEEYCEVTYTDIFGKDKIIEYTKKELAALDLAYAMTVHKLQGAGRKTVIGIIDNTHHQLLDNCMLYTLLTRAKKRCLLLAEPEAFLQCIRTSHNNRNTWMMLETENNTVEE